MNIGLLSAFAPRTAMAVIAVLLVAAPASPLYSEEAANGTPANAEQAPKADADTAPASSAGNRAGPKRRRGEAKSGDAKLDKEQARDLYIRRVRRLEQIRARQQQVDRDRRLLATNRARMRSRLIETAHALRRSEQRLGQLEQMLEATRANVKEQRARFDEKSAQLSALLSLLQGMSRQPPPLLITHSKDALNMIRSGMVLATFYNEIEARAARFSADLKTLETARKEAEKQEKHFLAEQALNNNLKAQLDALLRENHDRLETAEANLQELQGVAKINAASIKSLESMVPKLDVEVAKHTGLGAYEAELRQGTTELSPTKVALAEPGRMKPSLPFDRAQGLLPLPVQGKLVRKFDEPDQDGTPSKGLHIEARPKAEVVSPCDGWIIYAGPLRTYGQLLIINPGGGYHVVMAGMDRVQATVGQFVLAGEPVAVMGPARQGSDGKTSVRPTLYVEFRKENQAIDPQPWWSIGVGKG